MWDTAFETALYDGSSNLITALVTLKTTVNMVVVLEQWNQQAGL
jgi:hypothetical protein